jgi:hypothetical protein
MAGGAAALTMNPVATQDCCADRAVDARILRLRGVLRNNIASRACKINAIKVNSARIDVVVNGSTIFR